MPLSPSKKLYYEPADAPLRLPFQTAETETKGMQSADGVRIKQKLTHKQLAARIGTVREVITRVFLRLQNQGLIVVDGKEIFIPDLTALSGYADSGKN